jgi:hypothetical protein
MYLVYIDDSQDQATRTYVFSAVVIIDTRWKEIFANIRQYRRQLKQTDGIFVTKELHAWKFVSGRGRIAPTVVSKGRRCQIFKDTLQLLARQQGLRVFNAVIQHHQERAFERLLNRVNRTMVAANSHALIICDEGKEADYTRLVRKMSVHNPIPSRYGMWQGTQRSTKNIPLDRILEDPFFKDSKKSYFIQMADFCAYALLRRERPIPSKNVYGLDKAFQLLAPKCVKVANRKDPLGIIR